VAIDISAKDVMKLRNKTGAGMMDCKGALKATDGDMDAAADYLRKKGIAKAISKAERTAKEGLVTSYINEDSNKGSLVEINCETDFVAKTPDFQEFVADLARQLANSGSEGELDRQNLDAYNLADGRSVKDCIGELVAKLGENITSNKAMVYVSDGGFLTSYIHMGGKLGVLVEMAADGTINDNIKSFSKDVAMQIAASKPLVVDRAEVPPEWIEKEKEIYREQALNEGKPEKIIDRIAEGKLRKYFSEICLLEQPFVKETDITVGEGLSRLEKDSDTQITIRRFVRMQVGQNG
jgi:elongation factor Ts